MIFKTTFVSSFSHNVWILFEKIHEYVLQLVSHFWVVFFCLIRVKNENELKSIRQHMIEGQTEQ